MGKGLTPFSAAIAGRAFAANNYMQQPRFEIPEVPAIFECFSARRAISEIKIEVDRLIAETPEGMALVMTMRTPDGRIMDVSLLTHRGFSTFWAEGRINNLPCKVMGHVSTLSLFFAYEESRSKAHVPGFVIEVSEPQTSEPQPESEQK
jgi:hypothetical protein